jgi:hypothetical protein
LCKAGSDAPVRAWTTVMERKFEEIKRCNDGHDHHLSDHSPFAIRALLQQALKES